MQVVRQPVFVFSFLIKICKRAKIVVTLQRKSFRWG